MKRYLIAAVVCVGLVGGAGNAGGTSGNSGNDLWEWCVRDPDGFCFGYIVGAIDQDSTSLCIPKGAAFVQTRDVVVAYLKNNPENRHFHATTVLLLALREAWPCPK
jgi:hypothetical protein